MRSKSIAIALIMLLGAGHAAAEPSPPLTWQEAVRLATLRNPDLISARKAVEAGRAQYSGSYNDILPKVSLNASVSDGSGVFTNSRYQAGGTASLDLFNMSDYASIRSAGASLDQARASFTITSANVLSSLYTAFAGLLFAQEQIGVAQSIRDIWKHNAEMIALRYNSGRESKGNRMRTDAELTQADADLAQSGRDLRVAQQALNEVIGEEDFVALVATGTLEATPVPDHPSEIEKLVDRHPKVILQLAVVLQARTAVSAAQSTLLPTLSASYSRSVLGPSFFPQVPSWFAQGVVSYPLFAGGPTATYFAVAAARRNLEKAQEDLRSIRHQVKSALESAWSNYAQAQDQVRVQHSFLQAALQRRKESDIRYESGLLSFDNWELIVIDYVNFERSDLRAQRDAVLAEAQWKLALGQGIEDK